MTLEKLRVAVIRGGDTPSYESSLQTGENILKALRTKEERYIPVDIFVDRSGVWHVRGLPMEPTDALKHADLVWNVSQAALQDKRIEQHLDAVQIPYIGSNAVGRVLSGHIRHMRDIYAREKFPSIRYELLDQDEFDNAQLVAIFRNFLYPVSVRMHDRESKFGARLARTYKELQESVQAAFEHGKHVVVEEFMKGKEALVGIVENARGEKLYSFLPAEMRDGSAIAPGNFSPEEKRAMEDLSKKAHQALGLRHISVSRFLVTPRGNVYILETTASLDLSTDSALQKSMRATGWQENDLVEHLVNLSINN